MQSLDYSDHLAYLKLHSLQRRRERYCIIYVWEIIGGLVPNFPNPIVCSYTDCRGRCCCLPTHMTLASGGSLMFPLVVHQPASPSIWRRGRSCIVSHVDIGRLGTLAFNSFRWRAIRLFNAMHKHIRCISSCSVLGFKCKLDLYLRNIVHLPGRPGFNNSLDSANYKQWWTPRDDLAAN